VELVAALTPFKESKEEIHHLMVQLEKAVAVAVGVAIMVVVAVAVVVMGSPNQAV